METRTFEKELNHLLVSTFRTIEKQEQKRISKESAVRLSAAEIHLLEAVGRGRGPKTISALAERLSITLASVTVGVNKLVKKEILQKARSQKDGRVIYVTLTPKGKQVYRLHEKFHMKMAGYVSAGLSKEEKVILLRGIRKLRDFFGTEQEG